jgi:serine/threonine protein kinase
MVFVMEYMEGGELLELLKTKQKFEEEEAKIYFKQIVSAISHCHYKNIIHRDSKL